MSEDVRINTNDNTMIDENGKLNAFGMDISISDIIGEKIVDKWFAKLTPEDMALIFKAVDNEIFSHNYNDEKFFKTTREVKNGGWGRSNYEDTPLWRTTQQLFAKKYNEEILSKVDEIIASEEYQKKAMQIAEEIVDYATEGYKEDLKKRIYGRLVAGPTDNTYYVNNYDLQSFIHESINQALSSLKYN